LTSINGFINAGDEMKKECQCALRQYRKTKEVGDAGYIMPDGKMLDFQRAFGDSDELIEHNDVGRCITKKCKRGDILSDECNMARTKWMEKCGAIRVQISGDDFRAEAVKKPTEKQITAMISMIKEVNIINQAFKATPLAGPASLVFMRNKCPGDEEASNVKRLRSSYGDESDRIEPCLCIYRKDGRLIGLDIRRWISKCWR